MITKPLGAERVDVWFKAKTHKDTADSLQAYLFNLPESLPFEWCEEWKYDTNSLEWKCHLWYYQVR